MVLIKGDGIFNSAVYHTLLNFVVAITYTVVLILARMPGSLLTLNANRGYPGRAKAKGVNFGIANGITPWDLHPNTYLTKGSKANYRRLFP